MYKTLVSIFTLLLFLTLSCTDSQVNIDPVNSKDNLEKEKKAILAVLNNETKSAFERNYPAWKSHWIHEDYVTKTYMNFADTTMSETLGWAAINDFVKTYIEEHPEPAELPKMLDEIDVKLYTNGAWVSYLQNDPERGLKRETRLMEKVNEKWKIAGMQTII